MGQPPALIITGLTMPGIDGRRFCGLLRSPQYAALNDVPVLAVSSALLAEHSPRIAADLGADAFLPFPVDTDRFLAQVQALLAGTQPRERLRSLVAVTDARLGDTLGAAFGAAGFQAGVVRTADAAVLCRRVPAISSWRQPRRSTTT